MEPAREDGRAGVLPRARAFAQLCIRALALPRTRALALLCTRAFALPCAISGRVPNTPILDRSSVASYPPKP